VVPQQLDGLVDQLPAMFQTRLLVPPSQLPKHLLARSLVHRFVHPDQGNWTSGASILQATQPSTPSGNKTFGAIRAAGGLTTETLPPIFINFMMKCLLPLLVPALACFIAAGADDDVVTLRYEPSQKAGELSCEANFYLWVPPDLKRVRGVIVHQHGCGQGAQMGCLAAARDLHWRALAEKWECALLGTSYRAPDSDCGAWAEPRRGSRDVFLRALRDLGERMQRPELASVPWCLWGHSGGGWWASTMLALEPERCIAVWLRSGSAFGERQLDAKSEAPPPVPDAALRVPVMGNPGVRERDDARFAKAYASTFTHFRDWRARGALIGFAPEPRSNHECGASRYLAIPFFDACLAARLPDKDGPLRPMPLAGAWLAAPFSSEARPAADFVGPPNDAVWLPNETIARAWSEYVREARVSDTTPPPAPHDARIQDGVLTWKVRADVESGLRGFFIERDGEPLASLPANQDDRSVFQGITFHDTPNDPPPALSFTDPSPKPGARYRITAVNTAGLKSKPTAEVVAP
jgi:hypothetical protein